MFLDTNVLVSALATRGLCADLYERLITEHETVIGEQVILEVLDILQRKFKATPTLLVNIEAELRLLEVIPAQQLRITCNKKFHIGLQRAGDYPRIFFVFYR